MAACVREAKQSLQELSLDLHIPICLHSSLSVLLQEAPSEERGGLDVCFFDDGAFVLIGPAMELLEAAPRVAEVVAAGFVRRGLRLNFSAGKTEALFRFRGRGAKTAKHTLWHDYGGQFCVDSPLLGHFPLKPSRHYPQLGTELDELGSIGPELAQAKPPLKLQVHSCADKSLPRVRMCRGRRPCTSLTLCCSQACFSTQGLGHA